MDKFNIVKMKYLPTGSFLGDGSKGLWEADVELDNGHALLFSQWDGETERCCDAHFGANCYPYFCHGSGSRCTLKQVAKPPLKAALEAARIAVVAQTKQSQ